MSEYTRYDFSESMDRATITPDKIDSVIAAWGLSPNGYGSWEGGFLMKLKDGHYAYLTGWCDTTGWGCQDGANLEEFETLPDWKAWTREDWCPEKRVCVLDWDEAPADLNKWLAEGADTDKVY